MQFGFDQIFQTTPKSVKVAMALLFILANAATLYIGATTVINDAVKVEAMLIIQVLEVIGMGVGKMFGVKPKE